MRALQHRAVLSSVLACAASIGAGVGCAHRVPASTEIDSVHFEPYPLHAYDGRTHDIELGKLSVPESREESERGGRRHTIAFLRLRSTSPAGGSPIVFLMGGPGIPASVMAPIPPYWELFDALRSAGDVILLDQRGLGLSSPRVDCPPLSHPLDTAFLTTHDAFIAAYRDVIAACAEFWRKNGVEPRSFTDAAVADDVDDIRSSLGAARVSLLGFSYGTRLAMTFARRHPDRLDAIVLQGPTDADLEYHVSLTYDSLLGRMAALAAIDSASAPFSQNLVPRLRALLERAAREPVRVPIRRAAGDSVVIPVGRDGLQALLEGHITDTRIPALVATLEWGDVSVIARWVESLYNDFSGGAGTLMARAVGCSAAVSEQRRALVDALAPASMFGMAFDNFAGDAFFCGALGAAARELSVSPRRRLTTRALFVTGELDDRTPVGNDTVLAKEFATSVRLIVANGGHEVLPNRGVRDAVVDFFLGRDVRGRVLRQEPPRFLSIDAARQPPRRPGR